MQFLAIEQDVPGVAPSAFGPVLRPEAEEVWRLQQAEVIRGAWFTRTDHRAILLLECGDEDEARRHLDGLPLVRAGLIAFELLPLRPYDGLARLFAPPAGVPPSSLTPPPA